MNEPDNQPIRAAEAPPQPIGPEHPTEGPQPGSANESAPERALARDVTTLIATVDQHSSEIDAVQAMMLIAFFAMGALAGVVFLQGRQIKELTGALPG